MTEKSEPELPSAGNKPPSGNGRTKGLVAVIIVLIVIIAGLSVLDLRPVVSQGNTPNVVVAANTAVTNESYNLSINTHGKFSDVNVYFGDGTHSLIYYNGSTNVTVSHKYSNPGNYYIYFTVNYGSKIFQSSGSLIKVVATSSALNNDASLGLINLIPEQSSSPSVNQTTVFTPGSHASFLVGYYTAPSNTSYQVVWQTLTVYLNGSQVEQVPLPYAFNQSSGTYGLPSVDSTFNLSNLQAGYYELQITTDTAAISNTTTGQINSSQKAYSTNYWVDVPVFNNAALYQATSSQTIFVNDEVSPGGYTTLDPAINYDLLGYEVLDNTMSWLLTYNKSSATSYVPALASAVPSIANGGINDNYANYTQTYVNQAGKTVTYAVNLTPYENFTFHIRSNATWQDGTPVTAWDVLYSMARTLLFVGGSPGTPGWIQAQYLLPGNYYTSNTFYNITHNITVNNATNNITFHFQNSMPPALVFETLETSGTWVANAKWLQANGAGLTWTSKGFASYISQSNSNNYNQYVENHIFASGPYKIAYIVPSSQVVLVANPNFVSPGPWYPKPSITEVVINYISKASTAYLAVKSGQAQGTSIPTSNWNDVISLNKTGAAKPYGYPSLGIFWYSFNAHVDTSLMQSSYASQGNLPSNLFSDLNVRKALSYAFNENLYLNYEVGNAIYNTQFGQSFAGALPAGMLYSQSKQELNASGAAVPYFSPTLAHQYWQYFLNGAASTLGISMSGSTAVYGSNNNPVVIPVFIREGNPADVGMLPVWSSNVYNATGMTLVPVLLPSNAINAIMIANSNPMPIVLNDWYPDYPYPTDYLGPIALPSNLSTFTGPADMTPYWIYGNTSNTYQNKTEATAMQGLISDYNNGSTASSSAQSKYWFQKMNGEFVNLTFTIPLYQQYQWRQISSKINPSGITTYEENIMVAGANIMLYQYLSYT